MLEVFVLNPRRGSMRKNAGTASGVEKSWTTRRRKYGVSGDRAAIKKAHHAGYTVSGLKRMPPAQLARVPAAIKKALGVGAAKKRAPAKKSSRGGAARKTTSRTGAARKNPYFRRNAWFEQMAPGKKPALKHSAAAKKKWVRGATPNTHWYGFVRSYGIPEAVKQYRAWKARGNDPVYSSPRTKKRYRYGPRTRNRNRAVGTPPSHRPYPRRTNPLLKKGTARVRRRNVRGASMAKRRNPRRRRRASAAPRRRRRRVNPVRRRRRASSAPRRRRRARRVNPVRRRRRRRASAAPRRRRRRNPVRRRRRRASAAPRRRRRRNPVRRRRRRASSAPRRRRRRRNPVARRRRRRVSSAPRRRRRRNPVRRRRNVGRRRRNPLSLGGLVSRLKASIPDLRDLMDAGVLSLSFVGVHMLSKPLFSKLGPLAKLPETVPYSDKLLTTVAASALTSMFVSPRAGKQVLFGGLMATMVSAFYTHVLNKGVAGEQLKNLAAQSGSLADYVTFRGRGMSGYLDFPASRAGQPLGDFVQFGQFLPSSAVAQAARIPSYQSSPYDVGMPMGAYEDMSAYYGVTAF